MSVADAPSCGYASTDRYFGGPGAYDMATGVHLGPPFETGCPNGQDVFFVIFKD